MSQDEQAAKPPEPDERAAERSEPPRERELEVKCTNLPRHLDERDRRYSELLDKVRASCDDWEPDGLVGELARVVEERVAEASVAALEEWCSGQAEHSRKQEEFCQELSREMNRIKGLLMMQGAAASSADDRPTPAPPAAPPPP